MEMKIFKFLEYKLAFNLKKAKLFIVFNLSNYKIKKQIKLLDNETTYPTLKQKTFLNKLFL